MKILTYVDFECFILSTMGEMLKVLNNNGKEQVLSGEDILELPCFQEKNIKGLLYTDTYENSIKIMHTNGNISLIESI